MPKGFKAEAVEELTFDFRPYADVSGVIPEPSADQIEEYNLAYQLLLQQALDAGKETTLTGEDKIRAAAELAKRSDDDLLTAVAKLCSDTPNLEQIKALPYRHRRAFLGFIFGVFSNPEE